MVFRVVTLIAVMVVLAGSSGAQLKSQLQQETSISSGLMSPSAPSLLFGWFNPEKFHMRHTFSLQYMTAGSHSLSLGMYTNSMMYEIADNLDAQADISLMYSPYNSLSTFNKKDDLSSIFLSRAQINYRPWENFLFQVQYRSYPYGTYNYYSPFHHNPWYSREKDF
jgi:hypothetical protein